MDVFLQGLADTFRNWWNVLLLLAPRAVAAMVFVVLAILVAALVRRALRFLLRRMQFDVTSHRLGLTRLLRQGGTEISPSDAVASFASGLVLAGGILQGLSALQVPSVDNAVSAIVTFLEHLVVAFVIAAGGYIVSRFFGRAALIAAANAHLRGARWIAAAVEGLILLFSTALALEHLGLAPDVVRDAFSILFGGVVLALALAFGLGGRSVAQEILEQAWHPEHPAPPDHEPPSELRHL